MNHVPIFEYTPLQVKTAVTGYGHAEKAQIMEMTRRLLRLKEIPRPDDAADALCAGDLSWPVGSCVKPPCILYGREIKVCFIVFGAFCRTWSQALRSLNAAGSALMFDQPVDPTRDAEA